MTDPDHRKPRDGDPGRDGMFEDARPLPRCENINRWGKKPGRHSDDTGYTRLRDDARYRARIYLRGEQPFPWRMYEGERPHHSTLSRWRRIARIMGDLRFGCEDACSCCYRPLYKGKRKLLTITWAGGGAAFRRTLCDECDQVVRALIDQMSGSPPFREIDDPQGGVRDE